MDTMAQVLRGEPGNCMFYDRHFIRALLPEMPQLSRVCVPRKKSPHFFPRALVVSRRSTSIQCGFYK